MTKTVELDVAQATLVELIANLKPNDDVVIMQNHKPVAKLVAPPTVRPPRVPGLIKGKLTIIDEDEAIAIRKLRPGIIGLLSSDSEPPAAAIETSSDEGERFGRGATSATPVVEWTDEHNARRCELIDKMVQGRLTDGENLELERLQQAMLRHINRTAPLQWDTAKRLHAALLQ